MSRIFLLGLCLIVTNTFLAQTELDIVEVIVKPKHTIIEESTGRVMYSLSEEELEKNTGKTLADVLNEVPGIQINGNFGSPGTNIGVSVRGGAIQQTLILIDGMPLNDPSSINAQFDLRLLPLNAIEEINVLKGGTSSLYGTGASSAVIDIRLKERQKGGAIQFELGSFEMFDNSANYSTSLGKLNIDVLGNYQRSNGFSAAESNTGANFEDDALRRVNGLLKLNYELDKIELDALVGYDDMNTEFDDGAFLDADNVQDVQQFRVGLTPTYFYDKGNVRLMTQYMTNDREFQSSFPSTFDGRNLHMELENQHEFSDQISLLSGVNYQSLSFEDGSLEFDYSNFSIFDVHSNLFYKNNAFLLQLGGRLNNHSEYDSEFVYSIHPSYDFDLEESTLRVHGSVSSAYITPSGFQLYSFFGNEELSPEESVTYEGGLSFIHDKFTVNGTYFRRDDENFIDFVSFFDMNGNFIGGEYQNLLERETNGVEFDFTADVHERVDLRGNLTYLDADNDLRIPEWKFGLIADVRPMEHWNVNMKYNFTDDRTDVDFSSPTGRMTLDSFGLFDVHLQREIPNQNLRLFLSSNNLFDTDFVGLNGFTTRGRTINGGVQLDLN